VRLEPFVLLVDRLVRRRRRALAVQLP